MSNFYYFYVLPPLLVLGAGFMALVLLWLVTVVLHISREKRLKAMAVCIGVFVTLTALELVLRVTGITATYMEKRTGYYWSPFEYNRDNILWNRDSGQVYKLGNDEFSYPRKANR
jgi:hypothetical protein